MSALRSPSRSHEAVPPQEPVLRLRGVVKDFQDRRGVFASGRGAQLRAVDGVDLEVYRGETLGIVGETGCGKSTLARVMMRLLTLTAGSVEFDGQDITHYRSRQLRPLRREMQMVFQDPYASLNPRRRVGSIIADPLSIHRRGSREGQKAVVQELMEVVGLNPEHYHRYPQEFSGGQRQRIGVARALALRPKLVVCDEPVSALDVSIQAQLINLLLELQSEFQLTYVFIAHDLSVVRHVSDRVAVMYMGKLVEVADADTVYERPKHPYTATLLSASPVADPDLAMERARVVLSGEAPSPFDLPSGCRFHPRCPEVQDVCRRSEPELEPNGQGAVACYFPLSASSVLLRRDGDRARREGLS